MGRGLLLLWWMSVGSLAMAQEPVGEEGAAGEAADVEAEAEAPAAEEPAEDPRIAEARERIARGEALYEENNYEAALAEFNTTRELLRGHQLRFLVLYNIARCQERLFRYSEAMASYASFLEEGGAFTDHAADVRAKIELLNGLLGTVRITVNLRNYEVWVDSRRIGENQTEILVPGGAHVVEIRSDGYTPEQQEVQVAAQSEATATFELERLAEEYEGLPPVLFWVTAGAAVGAALGGMAFGLVALNKGNEPDGRSPRLATADEVDSIQRNARNADILFGTAALLATTAIIFAVLTDWDDEEDPNAISTDEAEARLRLQVAPIVSRTAAGLSLGGSF